MREMTLVIVDTVGVQKYIFNSNRLRENVGASHLVHLASEGWLRQSPEIFFPKNRYYIQDEIDAKSPQTKAQMIEHSEDGQGVLAELLYAGGGNTVLLFRREADAKHFSQTLSRKLLCEAPGLNVVLVMEAFDWDEESLAKVMKNAHKKLAAKKSLREWSQPLQGVSVSVNCFSTGQAAALVESPITIETGDDPSVPISMEVKAKWANNNPAKERLKTVLLKDVIEQSDASQWVFPDEMSNQGRWRSDEPLVFPDDLDNLGRLEGDFSYVAVVHADGNSMGKYLEDWGEAFKTQKGDANRSYIQKMRHFSGAVRQAGLTAMAEVVKEVARWNGYEDYGSAPLIEPSLSHDRRQLKSSIFLSIRPIVYGGDDVTFICDGRIGLMAAQRFLQVFNQQKIPVFKDGHESEIHAVAAAGVAIVKVRYPFARAYGLSEALCKNAKDVFERKQPALDWRMSEESKESETLDLQMRPLRIDNANLNVKLASTEQMDWHTWSNFTQLLHAFQDDDVWPRSKVMMLRDALHKGSDDVRHFRLHYHSQRLLPAIDITGGGDYQETGWVGGDCVYFDAIEMIEQEVIMQGEDDYE
ncbi:MAG: hypothetical protein AAF639_43690 [Chloroflexota bacterium]